MAKLVPFRYRIMILCSILAFTALAGSAMSLVDTRPTTVRAFEWAEAGKKDGTLPSSLAELEEYPISFRKAAFKRLTPELRSSVMREHLTAFLKSEPLSAEQTALVQRLIAFAGPSVYVDGPKTEVQSAVLRGVCQEIARLFPEGQSGVFSSIGLRSVRSEARYVPWVRRAKTMIGEPVLNADASMHDCDCAGDTMCPDCGGSSGCVFGQVPACSKSMVGCGCLSAWSCSGSCGDIPCCD